MIRVVLFTNVPTQVVQRLTDTAQASQGFKAWAEATSPDTYQVVIDRDDPIAGRERKKGR